MINKYYLHFEAPHALHAGSKAVDDCEIILERKGYIRKDFFGGRGMVIKRKLINCVEILALFMLPKYSEVVVQHPIYINADYFLILSLLKKIRKSKIVFIIHDLESLRNFFNEQERFEVIDTKMVKCADVLIVHNNRMKEYIEKKYQIEGKDIRILRVFDYLVDDCNKDDYYNRISQSTKSIVIAGNLLPHKSEYLYKLSNDLSGEYTINAYGVNFDNKLASDRCNYQGAYEPGELPNVIEGSYGLVWDGTVLEKCNGTVGEYLKYNNPHKVSLYIATGIPIIIWEEAALAQFVNDEKIGIVVDSLNDIADRLSTVTIDEYNLFKENIHKLSDSVKDGDYLSRVLK